MERSTNHRTRTPPLDGGGNEDADIKTDATVPDEASRQPLIPQTCDLCTRGPSEEAALQMAHHALDLEDLSEEHSVSSLTITSTLTIEYAVCVHRGMRRAPLTAVQVDNRLRWAQQQRALASTYELPGGTSDFSQGWFDTESAHSAPAQTCWQWWLAFTFTSKYISLQDKGTFTHSVNSWLPLRRSW